MYWLPYSSHTSHHPSQTPCLPWISYATDARFMQDGRKAFHTFLWHFFPSLKQNFIAYHSSKVFSCPDSIFEIPHLWQSGFSRVYSNCCCSCSFESEIIKIGQSSHKIYSNNIVNFHESMTILKACTKKKSLETYWMHHVPQCKRKTEKDYLTHFSWTHQNGSHIQYCEEYIDLKWKTTDLVISNYQIHLSL